MEGTSAPQCRAIIAGIRSDVNGWLNLQGEMGEEEDGGTWMGEGLPGHLKVKVRELEGCTDEEIKEWRNIENMEGVEVSALKEKKEMEGRRI